MLQERFLPLIKRSQFLLRYYLGNSLSLTVFDQHPVVTWYCHCVQCVCGVQSVTEDTLDTANTLDTAETLGTAADTLDAVDILDTANTLGTLV